MRILENEQLREEIFDRFLQEEADLSYDWFTDYYQEEHGDRNKLKQDFTPDCICEVVTGMNECSESIADICAGTGGLTIKTWMKNKNSFFHCEEFAERAIPILLFNLAIRNVTGEIVQCDVLTNEICAVYSLQKGARYSSIEQKEVAEVRTYDSVIMNPPYSLSWSGQPDPRFEKYGTPPKSKADYAFVLHGLNMMKATGKLIAVLPHGVLFRGSKEGIIRENLIKDHLIKTIIGLPNNLFLNTGIPVCIMELQKTPDGIYFIDASKEFEKQGPRNFMREKHITSVMSAYQMRRSIDKFSYLADWQEIKKNDYNLNIPRYVDTFEQEEVPDLSEIFRKMISLEKETADAERKFYEMLQELTGTDAESESRLNAEKELMKALLEEKNGQMRFEL